MVRANDGRGGESDDAREGDAAFSGALLLLDASTTMEREARNGTRALDREVRDGPSAGQGGHGARASRGGGGAERAAAASIASEVSVKTQAVIKNADHRRLIYRWTNALIRAVGLKVPAGVVISQASKNKREKFDKFLLHYYGESTFGQGSYWFSNSNAPAFFSEIFYIATEGRVRCGEDEVTEIFVKADPNRQASTWLTSSEALERFGISREEVCALYCGDARFENGWAKGQPLCVSPPSVLPSSALSDIKMVEVPSVISGPASESFKRRRDGSDVASVSIRQQLTPLGWRKQPALKEALSPLEQKAIHLTRFADPNELDAPLELLPLILEETLERGSNYSGPKVRPCERNQVNKYFGELLGCELFSMDDVGAAFRVKSKIEPLTGPFKDFMLSHAKLKAANAAAKEVQVKRDAAVCTLIGLRESASSYDANEACVRVELDDAIAAQHTYVEQLQKNLSQSNATLEVAMKEFKRAEFFVKDGYINFLKDAYDLVAGWQDRLRGLINASLESTSIKIAECEIKSNIKAKTHGKQFADLEKELKVLVTKRTRLDEISQHLDACVTCVNFARNTLDQRWNRFSVT